MFICCNPIKTKRTHKNPQGSRVRYVLNHCFDCGKQGMRSQKRKGWLCTTCHFSKQFKEDKMFNPRQFEPQLKQMESGDVVSSHSSSVDTTHKPTDKRKLKKLT